MCGEPNLDQAGATSAASATSATGVTSQAEGQWTCDPAWLDQFEEMFNGSQQENPVQEPDYMDDGVVDHGMEWSGAYNNTYVERGEQSHEPYCEPNTQFVGSDSSQYCVQNGGNCIVHNADQCLDTSVNRCFEPIDGCCEQRYDCCEQR